LCFTDGKTTEKLFHKDDIRIPGMHNVENYLTAISILHGDVDSSVFAAVAKEFCGVEHRIEFVRELDGVKYYNDSIATSPASVIAGLNSFDKRLIVIAGGSDKMLDYNTMSHEICEHVKLLILLGETAPKIEKAVLSADNYDENEIKIIHADCLENAVNAARENANIGDVVTLSPASASFDLYKDFEERGRHFKSIVNNLK
ncbi:MAG: cyanophycin synthetase, partial [Acutalibacteraceae bacterium]|nr:cyanophycin synthetase [Acutalibacteraceae bacterium]